MVVKILQPALSGHFYVLIQLLFHWWRQNCCNNQGLLQPAWQDAANKGGRSSDLLTSEWGCRPFFQRVVAWTHCGCSPLLKRAKYRRVICMCYGTVLSERKCECGWAKQLQVNSMFWDISSTWRPRRAWSTWPKQCRKAKWKCQPQTSLKESKVHSRKIFCSKPKAASCGSEEASFLRGDSLLNVSDSKSLKLPVLKQKDVMFPQETLPFSDCAYY